MRKLLFILPFFILSCSTEETSDLSEPVEYQITIKDKCDTDAGVTYETYCISKETFDYVKDVQDNIPIGAPKYPCEKNPLLEFEDINGVQASGYMSKMISGPGVCD